MKLDGVCLDQELTPSMRLMGKMNRSTLLEPFGNGGGNHPSGTNKNEEHNTDVPGQATNVLGNRAVNEIRGGSGLYSNDVLNTNVLWPMGPLTIAVIRI